MLFQKNTAFNKHHYFENKIIKSQERIQYEVINVSFVKHPSEIYNTLICLTVFFNEKKRLCVKSN